MVFKGSVASILAFRRYGILTGRWQPQHSRFCLWACFKTIMVRILWCATLLVCHYVVEASSSQRKYDGNALLYDPKGRMFQVEYAMEATRRGRTIVGVCADGCVALVSRGPSSSSSCCAVAAKDVWAVDSHVGIAASGLRSDVQYVADCARTWCSEHRFVFGSPMPCHMLTRRLADLIHACTTRAGKRPLAVDILVAGVDEHAGASLHRVQATGAFQRYRAVAVGGGGVAANSRLANPLPWAGGWSDCECRDEGGDSRDDGGGSNLSRAEQEGSACSDEEKNENSLAGSDEGNGDLANEEGVNDVDDEDAADQCRPHFQQRQRRRQRAKLAPEHQLALKRALLALWETEDDDVGRSPGDGTPAAAGTLGQGLTHGGIQVSELSATVFGIQEVRRRGVDGCRELDGAFVALDGDGNERRRWSECAPEECKELLCELEKEELEARKAT